MELARRVRMRLPAAGAAALLAASALAACGGSGSGARRSSGSGSGSASTPATGSTSTASTSPRRVLGPLTAQPGEADDALGAHLLFTAPVATGMHGSHVISYSLSLVGPDGAAASPPTRRARRRSSRRRAQITSGPPSCTRRGVRAARWRGCSSCAARTAPGPAMPAVRRRRRVVGRRRSRSAASRSVARLACHCSEPLWHMPLCGERHDVDSVPFAVPLPVNRPRIQYRSPVVSWKARVKPVPPDGVELPWVARRRSGRP